MHWSVFHKCTRFYALFYVKKEVSAKTSFIFLFYCGTVSRETGEKWLYFSDFSGINKWNWQMVSWVKTDIKLWNCQIRSGKKIETDGTRLGGFIISFQFMYETISQFNFLMPRNQKNPNIFSPVLREIVPQ